jgi:hypothetical protein
MRSATRKLAAAANSAVAMAQPAAKSRRKIFHATVEVTRVEEWFVEAATAEEARALLESGRGQRAQVGECTHLEISRLSD